MSVRVSYAYHAPAALPNGWSAVPIGEVAKIVAGIGFPKHLQGKQEGDIPVFKVGDISKAWQAGQKSLLTSPNCLTEEEASSIKAKLYPAGTIVFAKIGEALRLNRRAVLGRPSIVDNNVMGLIPANGVIDPAYLFYFMQTVDLGSLSRATAVPSVRKSDVQEIVVPLAPIEQQKSIVAEIDKQFSRLDEAVANLKRVKANLKRYKAAVLKAAVEGKLTEKWRKAHPDVESAGELIERVEQPPRPNRYATRSKDLILGHRALAVGNPGTPLPAGWAWVPLVDIARMESGHTPSRRHPEWWDGDVAWIGIADAREHDGKKIHDTQQHTNADGLANSAARLLPAGTVCVSRTASVGYVVVMGKDMATSQDFINWVPTEVVSSDWLRIIFSADRDALRRFGKGSVHKTIYFPEWLSVHIALPPLEEQRRIVDEVERRLSSMQKFDSALSANSVRADRLRQSILGFSFKGL